MIKAIETTYKGYRFRSRLEARWAVFFDALGYSWEYEPEGFDIDGLWYLPDFRIQGIDTNPDKYCFWFEVKPSIDAVDQQGLEKLTAFSQALDGAQELILLDGLPDIKGYAGLSSGMDFLLWSHRKRPWWICEDLEDEIDYSLSQGYHYESLKAGRPIDALKRACNAAKSARFEHGESGARK